MPAAPFEPRFFERDPLFWPIAAAAAAFSDCPAWPPVSEYGSRLDHRAPVHFREQLKKPRGSRRRRHLVAPAELYDGRITLEGWVPTRPSHWHDFLNMLVWATFPAAKWQLHNRQHRAQASRLAGPVAVLPNARTREQDALALLDEGGVVVVCDRLAAPELRAALEQRRGTDARALFASGAAHPVIFGHALYEGLVLHHDGGWGAALIASPEGDFPTDPRAVVTAADALLAATLGNEATLQSPDGLVRLDLDLIRR